MHHHATNQHPEQEHNDISSTADRQHLIQQIMFSNSVDPSVLQFIFGDRSPEHYSARKTSCSPLLRLFMQVSEQGQRPVSRRQEQSADSTLLKSRDVADSLLDLSFLCKEALLQIWI